MLAIDQKVYVYRNLHKQCWSVRDCKTKRVVAHLDCLTLRNAKFKVSEAGRQRVLREKKKNVHAGVQGCFQSGAGILHLYDDSKFKRVRYDPYKRGDFYLQNGRGINESSRVVFDALGRVYAL